MHFVSKLQINVICLRDREGREREKRKKKGKKKAGLDARE